MRVSSSPKRRRAHEIIEQIKADQPLPDLRLLTLHQTLLPGEREKYVEFIAEVHILLPGPSSPDCSPVPAAHAPAHLFFLLASSIGVREVWPAVTNRRTRSHLHRPVLLLCAARLVRRS